MGQPYFPEDYEKVANTPVLTLGLPLHCFRATVFDPFAKNDVPLPSHGWLVLFEDMPGSGRRAIARSNPSDADGISTLMFPNLTLQPGWYSFGLVPEPAEARKSYMRDREAWIDLHLTPHDWAVPPDPAQLERRQLLRLPAWSTSRKAEVGGGFKMAPPAASHFADTGALEFAEFIVPFGTPAKPWEIQLDLGWVKGRVRYFFFDWKNNRQDVVPPGLVVEAAQVDGSTARVVAKGSSVSPTDGTAYLLFESADRAVWKQCHLQFHAPGGVRVDVTAAAGSPDTRLTSGGTVPTDRSERNQLPTFWHSHGMRARYGVGASPASPTAAGKTWNSLREDIAKDPGAMEAMVFFHLDDVVLCQGDGRPLRLGSKDHPPTLFDHYLKIVRPSRDKPYQTDVTLVGSVIPAEVAFLVGSPPPAGRKVADISTRLIHYEGSFHDLRDDRVTGTSTTVCVGARAAPAGWHPTARLTGNPHMRTDGKYELHAIDVPGVSDPATGRPLQHMLMFLSVAISKESGFPAPDVLTAQRYLHDSAERWSHGHPGTVTISQGKRYALVPQDPTQRNSVITRIRTFFCEVTKDAFLKLELNHWVLFGDPRAHRHPPSFLNDQSIEYFDADVRADAAMTGITAMDSDRVGVDWRILAHEFGHGFGLPDEYCEFLNPKNDVDSSLAGATHPVLPTFGQPDEGWGDWRPFWSDDSSMMSGNKLTRLRHFWHHARIFNEDTAFAKLTARPYNLVHETLGPGGITYRTGTSSTSPYREAFAGTIPGTRAQAALYELGDDEGSVETLFAPVLGTPAPRASADRFDAVLIVRSRLRFQISAFEGNPLKWPKRWDVLQAFQNKIWSDQYRARIRFTLLGGPKYPRIAVLFQPHYAYGMGMPLLDPVDATFEIVENAVHLKPNPFLMSGLGSSITVECTDWVFEPVFRYLLGAPTWVMTSGVRKPNLAPIHPGDLTRIAEFVASKLGEPRPRAVGVF